MDNDTPDHRQMPSPMIKLQSSDGVIFQVEVKVACLSLHLKRMMDDLGVEEDEVISIPQNGPNISGAILEKIIQWANHHKDDPSRTEDDEKEVVKSTDEISSWDAEFLELVDRTTLVQMIRAANYLDIEGLLDVTCKRVAKMIKEITGEEVRQKFRIRNDWSPEEEEQVRRENLWFEGFYFEEYDYIRVNSVRQGMDMEILGNGGGLEIEDCLNNSIVTRKIFQHFSDIELLELSTVNKLWNYEARSVIKERGMLFAHVRCTGRNGDPSQGNVQVFLAAIQNMNIVPFSGIKIIVQKHQRSEAFPNEAFDPINDVNLDQLQLKKVSLRFYGANDDCPGLMLAKQVFQDFSEVLEELLLHIHADNPRYIEDVIQEYRFPLLKVLKLRKRYHNSDVTYLSEVKELVSRAPNLEELHTTAPIASVLNVVGGSSVVIVYMPMVRAPFNEVPQAAIGRLKLKDVELFYTGRRFNFERFSEITPALLKASCTTIRSVRIDVVLAVPLMCYGVSLKRVESLEMRININYRQLELREPRILGIVKHFDFTRTFPNLRKVQICDFSIRLSPDHLNRIVERANAVLTDPLPDRAAYVKELHLRNCNLSNATVRFLADMFPSIKKLEVEAEPEEEIPFGSIWEHWANLTELQVRGDITPSSGNLDGLFCGIFPEEVAELRLKDEEYLKRVHIVPAMPAITSLKNLRILDLRLNGQRHLANVKDGTLMFSKVTGLIAFARCPSLIAIMLDYGQIPEIAASHMEPFAFVITW